MTKKKRKKLLVIVWNEFVSLYFKTSASVQRAFIFPGVINEINRQIATRSTGRLFAVLYLCGTQFKVTESDVIIVSGHWPPQTGDKLKLEKVLLVGGTDFTLIGRPILNRELVTIDATVIQKTLSHTITRFRMRKRKQFRRLNCKICYISIDCYNWECLVNCPFTHSFVSQFTEYIERC